MSAISPPAPQQQNISKHLSVLADAGILGRRKDGNHVYYRIVDDGVLGLCEQVCGSLERRIQSLAVIVGGSAQEVKMRRNMSAVDRAISSSLRSGRDRSCQLSVRCTRSSTSTRAAAGCRS